MTAVNTGAVFSLAESFVKASSLSFTNTVLQLFVFQRSQITKA